MDEVEERGRSTNLTQTSTDNLLSHMNRSEFVELKYGICFGPDLLTVTELNFCTRDFIELDETNQLTAKQIDTQKERTPFASERRTQR